MKKVRRYTLFFFIGRSLYSLDRARRKDYFDYNIDVVGVLIKRLLYVLFVGINIKVRLSKIYISRRRVVV